MQTRTALSQEGGHPVPRQRDPRTGQIPVYDVMYLRRLRARMRAALLEAEHLGVDWNGFDQQHKDRTGDPGRMFINKRDDLNGIQATWDALTFHREWARMYSDVLSAECLALPVIRHMEP